MKDFAVGKSAEKLFGKEASVLTDTTMQVTAVTAMVSMSGIFLVSPIVTELTGPLGVTEPQAGQVVTVFTAPLIVLVLALGYFADRIGRKIVLLFGLVTFGIAGIAGGFVSSFEALLVFRFLQGVGHAAIVPVTVTLLGDLYSGEREATAQGVRSAGIQGVGLIAPVLAGTLAVVSWRVPFFLFGIALFVAVWVWVSFPTVDSQEATSFAQYVRSLTDSVSRPFVMLVLISFFIRFVLTFSFFAFVSALIAQETSQATLGAGIVVSTFSLSALISTTQAGRLVNRMNPWAGMVGGFLLIGIGLIVMGSGVSFLAVMMSASVFGVGGGITAPLQKSLITQLSPSSVRAGSVSSAFVFQSVGQTAGPLLMGIALWFFSVGETFVLFGIVGGAIGIGVMGAAYVYCRTGLEVSETSSA